MAIGSEKRQVQVEFARCDLRVVLVPLEHQPPVVDPDAGALGLGVRERETGARRALLVDQAAALRIGDGGVGQQYLARIEAARVVGLFLRPRAEEGDLEAHRPVEPAGDVPPLGAVLGMRAVIARELQAMVRNDLGIRRQREQLEEVPSSHQSSRTARTGPIPIASFPERIAVKTARPTRIKIKTPNNPYGGCSSINRKSVV